jgi:hypothetical protein
MLRRFPQRMRDRLLMNTMGLRREAFHSNGAPEEQTAGAGA